MKKDAKMLPFVLSFSTGSSDPLNDQDKENLAKIAKGIALLGL